MEGVSFLPSSQSYLYYSLALIFLLIINKRLFNNGAIIDKRYFLFAILFVYFAVVDLINSGEIGRYALLFMYMLLIYPFLNNKKAMRYVLITYVLISVKLSFLLFIFKDQFAQNYSGIDRVSWVDPNYFASTIGIGFTITVLFSLKYIMINNLFGKTNLLLIFQFLNLTTIALSGSRGAIVGVSVVLIFAMLYSNLKIYQKSFFLLSFTFVITLIFLLGYLDVMVYRFIEDDSLNTGSYRTLIWGMIFNGFFDLPLYSQLLGSGYEYSMVLSNGMLAHNEFIGLLTDYGFVGLGLFLIIIFKSFNFKKIFTSSSNYLLLFFLLIAMTLNPFRTVAFSMLLLIVLKLKNSRNQDTRVV
jgi:hypothetical protein